MKFPTLLKPVGVFESNVTLINPAPPAALKGSATVAPGASCGKSNNKLGVAWLKGSEVKADVASQSELL